MSKYRILTAAAISNNSALHLTMIVAMKKCVKPVTEYVKPGIFFMQPVSISLGNKSYTNLLLHSIRHLYKLNSSTKFTKTAKMRNCHNFRKFAVLVEPCHLRQHIKRTRDIHVIFCYICQLKFVEGLNRNYAFYKNYENCENHNFRKICNWVNIGKICSWKAQQELNFTKIAKITSIVKNLNFRTICSWAKSHKNRSCVQSWT